MGCKRKSKRLERSRLKAEKQAKRKRRIRNVFLAIACATGLLIGGRFFLDQKNPPKAFSSKAPATERKSKPGDLNTSKGQHPVPADRVIFKDSEMEVTLVFEPKTYRRIVTKYDKDDFEEFVAAVESSISDIIGISRRNGLFVRDGPLRIVFDQEHTKENNSVQKGVYNPDTGTLFIGPVMFTKWKEYDTRTQRLNRFLVFIHEFSHTLGTRNGIYSLFKGDFTEEEYANARKRHNEIIEILKKRKEEVTGYDIWDYLNNAQHLTRREKQAIRHFDIIPRPPGGKGVELELLEEGLDQLMAQAISRELAKINPKIPMKKVEGLLPNIYGSVVGHAYLIASVVGVPQFLKAYVRGDYSKISGPFFSKGICKNRDDFISQLQDPVSLYIRLQNHFGKEKIQEWLNQLPSGTRKSLLRGLGKWIK